MLKDDTYEQLRVVMLTFLGDLERTRQRIEKIRSLANPMGGSVQKEAVGLGDQFDQVMHHAFRLEQALRENPFL